MRPISARILRMLKGFWEVYGGVMLVLYLPIPVLTTILSLNETPEWHRDYIGDWMITAYLVTSFLALLLFAIGRRLISSKKKG